MRALAIVVWLSAVAGCQSEVAPPDDAAIDSVATCTSSSMCDDGDFCTGVEACDPDSPDADARGCVGSSSPCDPGERCVEEDDECVPDGCERPDSDGDGVDSLACGGLDCDDDDVRRSPANLETCDGASLDEDCDADTFGDRDADGDGHVDSACCNVADGMSRCGDDCDDADDAAHPGGDETCDGVDNDCDRMIDESVRVTFYRDVDGDGFGVEGMSREACSAPAGYTLATGDCDDARAQTHPGALDACNAIDDDCDGTPDPGCTCLAGSMRSCGPPDGSGGILEVGECEAGVQTCTAGTWGVCAGHVEPTPETCDVADDDCDGFVDETVQTTYFRDADSDGYGLASSTMMACSAPAGHVAIAGDCDDTMAGVRPGTPEACNARDDDCDGTTDEMVGGTFYRDADGDGYGATSTSLRACSAPAGYVATGGDCDDAAGSVHPGAADACDGIDNDCNGIVDPGCSCVSGAMRACGTPDGSGGFLMVGICRPGTQTCTAGAWGACTGNVDGRAETCNALDDDCDTRTDEGVAATCYADGDGDGYAPIGATAMMGSCTCGAGTTSRAPISASTADCDDTLPSISPGAPEGCDARDSDCSSGGGYLAAEDADGDRHTATTFTGCSGGPYPRDDCDDTRVNVHPGQTGYFMAPYAGSFDYDCDGLEEAEDPTVCPMSSCAAATTPMCGGMSFCVGWLEAVPGCGTLEHRTDGTCRYRIVPGDCAPNFSDRIAACH